MIDFITRNSNIVPLLEGVLFLWAFITGNSSLEPLPEDLFAQIHVDLR